MNGINETVNVPNATGWRQHSPTALSVIGIPGAKGGTAVYGTRLIGNIIYGVHAVAAAVAQHATADLRVHRRVNLPTDKQRTTCRRGRKISPNKGGLLFSPHVCTEAMIADGRGPPTGARRPYP